MTPSYMEHLLKISQLLLRGSALGKIVKLFLSFYTNAIQMKYLI